jgi:hypothetical protein
VLLTYGHVSFPVNKTQSTGLSNEAGKVGHYFTHTALAKEDLGVRAG